MNAFSYILRRPVKTILGVALVFLACILLCLCIGQYYASLKTQEEINSQYTTIAIPTNKYKIQDILDENGNRIGISYMSHQPVNISALLSELPSDYPDAVKAIAKNVLISGYCEEMEPLNYAEVAPAVSVGNGLTSVDTDPYTYAILSVKVNSVAETSRYFDQNQEDFGVVSEVEGTVTGIYALQEGFASPEGWKLCIQVRSESREAFDDLGIEIGKTYLVFGTDYTDNDWNLRHWIAAGDQAVYSQISWDKVEYIDEEQKSVINRDNHLYGIEEDDYVAVYKDVVDGQFFGVYLRESQLEMINSSSLTVMTNPRISRGALNREEITLYYPEGMQSVTPEEYDGLYQRGGIVEITEGESIELAALDEVWQTSYEALEINNHSFPIIGTESIKNITQFATEEAILSDGRNFSELERQNGAAVCIISETLAVKNGLDIGDSISVRYYDTDSYIPGQVFLKSANPSAACFSNVLSFNCEPIEYEIIGLYRQKQEWNGDEYSFTPNTIFVPENSIVGNTTTSDSGIFCSYILENGKAAYLEEKLTALGYEGLLAYYDQGYSDIAENLKAYHSTALWGLMVGVVGWIIFIFLFVLLFSYQQRNYAERMWTLGTPKKKVTEHIMKTNLYIALPGALLGTVASALSIKIVLQKIFEYANLSPELSAPVGFCVVIGFSQMFCLVLALYIAAKMTVRRFYKTKI